jgi:hypothetical protein
LIVIADLGSAIGIQNKACLNIGWAQWHRLARMKKWISDQFLNLNGWHFDPV